MAACLDPNELWEYVAGTSSPAQQQRVSEHATSCDACRRLIVRATRDTSTLGAGAGRERSLSDETLPADGGTASPTLPLVDPASYRLDGEHARGGIGRILRAEDRRLSRPVAVKELIRDGADVARRFVREAVLTARLQHPSIVPVYEAGRWPNGRPFYAMKFVSGQPLSALISKTRTLEQRLALLPHVIAVAEAIAYAHAQHIIHRDLKPGNVMVGEYGETLVVDWGLGKDLAQPADSSEPGFTDGGDAHETMAGAVLGTPAFMAPEQARGEPVDERADVYALGAILYTLLAGQAPYGGDKPARVLAEVAAGNAPSLARLSPGVPADLLDIVNKAMAPDPQARYANAATLASDLKHFQSGQLVGAHHYSRLELAARWVGRHRTPVALAAVFGLMLAGVALVAVLRIVAARAQAERERTRAETRGNELVLAGARAMLDRDPTSTLAWLKQYPPDGDGWDEARDLALEAIASGAARAIWWPGEWVSFPALSPDGTQLAMAAPGPRSAVDIRDLATGAIVRSLPVPELARHLSWSRDGHFLAARLARQIALWNLDTGALRLLPCDDLQAQWFDALAPGGRVAVGALSQIVKLLEPDGRARVLTTQAGHVVDLEFLDDGHRLLFADSDGNLELWNLDDSTHRRWHTGGGHFGFVVAPDQQLLMTHGERVELWDRDGTLRARGPEALGGGLVARFSADGELVAVGGNDGVVRVWDRRAGTVRQLTGHERGVNALAFTRDGKRLISGSRDATIRVWDLGSGDSLTLRGHRSQIAEVYVSSDGGSLVSIAADRSLRLWTLPAAPLSALRVASGEIHQARSLDDDRIVASSFESGHVLVIDPAAGTTQRIGFHAGGAGELQLSRDGRRAFSDGEDGEIAIYDVATWREERRLRLPGTFVFPGEFSCDSRALLYVEPDADKTLLLDLADGTSRLIDEHAGQAAFFSPDCTRIFTQQGKSFALHALTRDGAPLATLTGHHAVLRGRVFSGDGATLVSGDSDGDLYAWNVATGQGRLLEHANDGIEELVASPDHRLVAVGGGRGELGLYEFATGRYATLRPQDGAIYALSFSRDGKRLVAGGPDRMLRIWDVATLSELDAIAVTATITDAGFSRDGTRVFASDNAGMVRVWRLLAAAPATRDPAALREWVRAQTTAELRPDRTLASP
jgi:WD40 repeat protein